MSNSNADAGGDAGANSSGHDGNSDSEQRSIGRLPNVPDTFVTFGAGCLATATLLTIVAFLFVGSMFVTGRTRGLADYQVTLAAVQMGFATAMLAAGTYSALKRVRWTLVMLAAIMGSFAIITIPFTVLAIVCIGLGKIHFSANLVD